MTKYRKTVKCHTNLIKISTNVANFSVIEKFPQKRLLRPKLDEGQFKKENYPWLKTFV